MALDQFEFKITSFGEKKLKLKRKNNPEAIFKQDVSALYFLMSSEKMLVNNGYAHLINPNA